MCEHQSEYLEETGDGYHPERHNSNLKPLSPREKQVLRILVSGMKYSEIAKFLQISEQTVKTHMDKVRDKLGAVHNEQAVYIASQHKLMD